MTENKGDLISREALKNKIQEVVENEMPIDKKWALGLRYAMKLIDNATTVEPEITEKQALTKIINSGWLVNHDKELRKKWERPQGEWIKDNSGNRFCSECGSCALYHEIGTQIESQFCPNCGADMRGGAE